MVKFCKGAACTRTLTSGSVAYYCCDRAVLYCGWCKNKACSKCNQYPNKEINPRLCEKCDANINLLTCECGRVVCKSCSIYQKSCQSCRSPLRQFFAPNFKPEASTSLCPECQRYKATCICRGSGNPSPAKFAEMGDCSSCYDRVDANQMFCNICGHFYCRKCLSKVTDRCLEMSCGKAAIERSMLAAFQGVQLCLMCESPLSENIEMRYGPDKNVCQNCKAVLEEPEITVQKEPQPPLNGTPSKATVTTAATTATTLTVTSVGAKGMTDSKKENVGSSPIEAMRLPLPKAPQPPTAAPKSPRNNDKLPPRNPSRLQNNFLTPNREAGRGDPSARTPQKSLRTPSASQKSPCSAIQNSPSGETRSKSKSIASNLPPDPATPVPCVLCNVAYPYRQLLPINCPNKHLMCRCCALLSRGNKCEVCKKLEQEHLDKYFCYKELSNDDKGPFNEKLMETGHALCWACNIVVEKSRVMLDKGKAYCRACVIKTK